MNLKCPAPESRKYLYDREAEYHIDGTIWCWKHARRLMNNLKGGQR